MKMTADMFTKGLAKTKFAKLREKAGIKDITVYEWGVLDTMHYSVHSGLYRMIDKILVT